MKIVITCNAPVSAPLTALQLLERTRYSASLCLVSGTLTGTLHAIQLRFLGLWKRKTNHQISIGVAAGKQPTSFYPVHSSNRGILMAGRLKISTNFPLGIFIAWSYYKPEYSCLVYPAPNGQKQLPLNTLNEDEADYGTQSGTDDFSGFRKYRPGDPVNSIAWKAFAKEQGLLIKQFSGKGSQILILNWESVSHISDIESRLSQLCYWILLAEQSYLYYGLEIPNIRIEPGHGTHLKERCLEALARYGN